MEDTVRQVLGQSMLSQRDRLVRMFSYGVTIYIPPTPTMHGSHNLYEGLNYYMYITTQKHYTPNIYICTPMNNFFSYLLMCLHGSLLK